MPRKVSPWLCTTLFWSNLVSLLSTTWLLSKTDMGMVWKVSKSYFKELLQEWWPKVLCACILCTIRTSHTLTTATPPLSYTFYKRCSPSVQVQNRGLQPLLLYVGWEPPCVTLSELREKTWASCRKPEDNGGRRGYVQMIQSLQGRRRMWCQRGSW